MAPKRIYRRAKLTHRTNYENECTLLEDIDNNNQRLDIQKGMGNITVPDFNNSRGSRIIQ